MKSIKLHFGCSKEDMRFSGTEGDWTDDGNGNYTVWIIKLDSPLFMMAILFHELIEMLWCYLHGVTAADADAFDAIWYKKGIVEDNIDYGTRKDCPYRVGHKLGIIIEYIVVFMISGLGFRKAWNEYGEQCDKAIINK